MLTAQPKGCAVPTHLTPDQAIFNPLIPSHPWTRYPLLPYQSLHYGIRLGQVGLVKNLKVGKYG